jgi:hypothetical protein
VTDLGGEMGAAVEALPSPLRTRLLAAGIDPRDLGLGMVGTARIRIEGGLYTSDPDGGMAAFITPARLDDPRSPESKAPDGAVRIGAIVDLVAWRPDRPSWWALQLGAAEWLGAIGPQYCNPPPVHIRRSVLQWLQHACQGLLPLSHQATDVWRLLSGCVGGLVVENESHATELRHILERPWPTPRIIVVGARRDAA